MNEGKRSSIKNNTDAAGDTGIGAIAGVVVGNVFGDDATETKTGTAAGGILGAVVGSMNTGDGILIKYRDHDNVVKIMSEIGYAKGIKLGKIGKTVFINKRGHRENCIMPNNLQTTHST